MLNDNNCKIFNISSIFKLLQVFCTVDAPYGQHLGTSAPLVSPPEKDDKVYNEMIITIMMKVNVFYTVDGFKNTYF